MLTPYRSLVAAAATDSGSPRLTWYDRTGSATDGERVELSGRVLLTWVSKAANLLQDTFDVTAGSTVALRLPTHWRAGYWALATWALGATLVTGLDEPADVLVTDTPEEAAHTGSGAVLVTLPALARRHPLAPLPARIVDEAADIAGYPDTVQPWSPPAPAQLAWLGPARASTYADLSAELEQRPWGERPRVLRHGELSQVLADCALAWAAGGSVVLVGGNRPPTDDLVDIERVTAR